VVIKIISFHYTVFVKGALLLAAKLWLEIFGQICGAEVDWMIKSPVRPAVMIPTELNPSGS